MENKILEELKRIKLLSNYDSKLTLSENYSILDEREIVSEQTQAFLKQGSRQLAKTVARDIDAIFKSFKGGLKSVDNVALKNGDEVVKAIKAGKLAPAALGKVNMGLFRQTQDAGLKSAIARDISSTANFGKTMSSVKTEKEAVTALMNGQKKFTQQEAELLVKEFKSNGGVIGKRTAQQTATSTITKPKKRTRNPARKENTFGNWKKIKFPRWSSMSRTQKVLAIAGAGLGIYLLWDYFTSEEPGIFTDCVLGFMSDEDLALMAQKEFGDGIIITDVPNRQVAALGGVKLFTDGSLETVTGGVKGTWKDNGTSISVTIDGKTYEIPCKEEIIPSPDPDLVPNPGKPCPVGNAEEVKRFHDWLDKNVPNWHDKYGKLNKDVQKGYGMCGPRTRRLWEQYKSTYPNDLQPSPNPETSNPLDGEQSLETETGEVMASSSTPAPEETTET